MTTHDANDVSGPSSPLRDKLRSTMADGSVAEAFFVFSLTRLLILAIIVVTGAATLNYRAATFDPTDPHPIASLRFNELGQQLDYTLSRGDAGWYLGIARDGYERRAFENTQAHNWVFFPLYPALVSVVGAVTGKYLIAGALLSNALFFVALVLLHKLVLALRYDRLVADRTIFYTAIFPVSYFFSLPITEALFLCVVAGSFLAAARGHWWAAGLLGAAASATRLNGLLLLPALAIFSWQQTPRALRPRELAWLALVPAGVLAFSAFLWKITGHPLAFIDAIAAWDRKSGFFLAPLWEYITHPLRLIEPWDFRLLNFAAAVTALAAAAFWIRKKQWAFAAFSFLMIFLPLSSMRLQSLARYTSVIFPVFIALALLGRNPRFDTALRVLFLVLLGVMTLCYALRFSFAAA